MFHEEGIFIYPVKSLLPVEVHAAEITTEGLRFDRQFMLVKAPADETAVDVDFLTIKSTFALCLFQPSIDASWTWLTITHTRAQPKSFVTVPLSPSPISLIGSREYRISIFGSGALGVDVGEAAAAFFSKHLEQPVRLLFITGPGSRDIPGALYAPEQIRGASLTVNGSLRKPQRLRFADAAPLLVTSSASEDDVRARLPQEHRHEDVIKRFRTNIHIEVEPGVPAYDEDEWATLRVRSDSPASQHIMLKCLFKCVRCLSLNVDMDTGGVVPTRRQVYGLLAKDRRVSKQFPHKPCFGQYAFAGPADSIIRIGDLVELSERA